MAFKTTLIVLTLLLFVWLMILSSAAARHSGAAKDRSVVKHMKLMKGADHQLGIKINKHPPHDHDHDHFMMRKRKQSSPNYKPTQRLDDSKSTSPGHSPGIGHG
ncbi:hypothetical protein Salat_2447000 [Sesamum alatum]|uniref:Uncharacterized protein n=1 Tax=Sesamum alatum TaxID=300844 RepID=A0AAE1XQJ6_9LAMI|nr:hypothetical protein Salat_2447000 [Sesamum alatum]